jgi:hypothetical protein
MFFWTLLLAHVIGDFPLQTDAIYRLKLRSIWGVLPHVAICTVMNIVALGPFLHSRYAWSAVVFLAAVHIVLDRSKIVVSNKLAGDNLFHFFLDQGFHILSIFIAAMWLGSNLDIQGFSEGGFHADRELCITLCALIFAAFGGTPITYYVQKHELLKKYPDRPPLPYPGFIKRFPGFFERFIATLGVIWGGWWFVLVPSAFLPRTLLTWRDGDKEIALKSTVYSLLISLFCGVLARIFI